jgi:hypothetical protein
MTPSSQQFDNQQPTNSKKQLRETAKPDKYQPILTADSQQSTVENKTPKH